jgi:sec-independent protein translocase protein TatA
MFRNPTTDLIVVLVIVLLIFGPKRLPGLGKQLGQGMREFKDSITGDSKHEDDATERPELTQATANPAPAAGAAQPQKVENAPASESTERPSAEVGSEQGS